jgi:hypothetical protein
MYNQKRLGLATMKEIQLKLKAKIQATHCQKVLEMICQNQLWLVLVLMMQIKIIKA